MNQRQKDLLTQQYSQKCVELKRQLKDRFDCSNLTVYSIRRHTGNLDKGSGQLSRANMKKYEQLMIEQNRLTSLEKDLSYEWETFTNSLKNHINNQDALHERALNRLSVISDRTIIQIQFAEDMDEVEQILDSIPSIEKLIK